ncbi:MAG: hypothetical protein K2P87_16635 [Lachnospiraceae bacterium]|nr:hypothetical protein [Lachnospiraceae bacterium]
MKRFIAILVTTMIFLATFPVFEMKAGIGDGLDTGVDMGTNILPDIHIWEDGENFHVMYKGVEKVLTVHKPVRHYLVTMETRKDDDGKNVTVICFNLSYSTFLGDGNGVRLSKNFSDLYYSVMLCAGNSYSGADYLARSYYILIEDGALGEFVHAKSSAYGSPSHVSMGKGTLHDETIYGERSGMVYLSELNQGKYKFYCNVDVVDNIDVSETLIPCNPLPATAPESGNGGYPCKTTFRMLTDGALIYNTYYYGESYASGTDEISAAGKIRIDTVKLADGAVSCTYPAAPQLLCQKSSYGKKYDIVYTNDDNLLSILGIEKPEEKYWDVAAQQWKDKTSGGIGDLPPVDFGDKPVTDVINPDGSSPFVNSETIPKVSGLTVAEDGVDAWIKYTDYQNAFGDSLMHKSTSPADAADAWGLLHRISWTLGSDPDGHSLKLQAVAKMVVQLKDGTEKTHFIIMQDYDGKHPGNNTKYNINASSGELTVALYDLILALTTQVKSYATAPPAKFVSVTYYFTPFYKDGVSYHRGSPASISKAVNKSFAAPPVDDSLLFPEPDTDGVLEGIGAFFKNIASMLTAIPSFLIDLISTFGEMIAKVGEIPLLLGTLFTFLPADVISILRLGVLACVVLGVIRWMRG